MVFQNFNLFSKKTALQNVMEGLIVVKKMEKKEAEKIAREQLKNVGLLDGQTIIRDIYQEVSSSELQSQEHLRWNQSCYF